MGDKIDQWIETIFFESSEVNLMAIKNINNSFWEDPEVK